MAIAASEACPNPASIIKGNFVCDLIILILSLFLVYGENNGLKEDIISKF